MYMKSSMNIFLSMHWSVWNLIEPNSMTICTFTATGSGTFWTWSISSVAIRFTSCISRHIADTCTYSFETVVHSEYAILIRHVSSHILMLYIIESSRYFIFIFAYSKVVKVIPLSHQPTLTRPKKYESVRQSAVRSKRTTCRRNESCQGWGGVAMSYLERQTSTLVLSMHKTSVGVLRCNDALRSPRQRI